MNHFEARCKPVPLHQITGDGPGHEKNTKTQRHDQQIVRRKAEREGLTRDQQPEEPKPVKKGAAKKASATSEADEAPATVELPAGAHTPAAPKPHTAKPKAAKPDTGSTASTDTK